MKKERYLLKRRMNCKIREAVPKDEIRIRELYLEMLKTVYHMEDAQGYRDGDLDRFWNGKKDIIYVAEDDEVVAFLSIEIHHEPKDYIYLDDFIVTETYRNMGIGTKLIRSAEAYARKNRIETVLLHVEKTNIPAMNLYDRLGYSIYRDDRHRFLMKKDILSVHSDECLIIS
jgi:ribosomal protein S18 acetylase RimI-like enzyme